MAMMRYGSAAVAEPSISSEQWTKTVCCGHKAKCVCGSGSCRVKVARTVLAKYDPQKYLLSHCTIVAAVDTEDAKESKSKYKDYLIHPAYSKLVNNNGDAWTKKMLASSYRTFVGSNNYLEHVQIAELAKGKIIDAVLREVPIGKDQAGKDLTSYYVDILVATERKHKELVRKIEAGELKTLSMGCKISFSICTKCGNKAIDETEACEHVRYEKGNVFYDENGTQRKIAELCGHVDEKDSVVFMDASWVANPAFTGAVIRNVVNPPDNIMAKIEEAEKKESYQAKETDYLKAANKTAQDPKDKPIVEEPTAEPVDEAPTEKPSVDAPAEEPVPEEAPEPGPEEQGQNDVQTWKRKIKQKLLDEIGDQIVNEFSGEDEEGPRELETLEENLIQPTASLALKRMWMMKRGWDKYLLKFAGDINPKDFKKLKFGTYMILTSNDLKSLADYGYNRRDFLAVMSCLDSCFKNRLSKEIIKALTELNGTKGLTPQKAVYALQKYAGRKLTDKEATKALTWLKLMDPYPES
jgi:hypothetical protein